MTASTSVSATQSGKNYLSLLPCSLVRRLMMVSSITTAERGGEIDALGGNVLLIAVLLVEDVLSFDGSEVAGFVVVNGGIFDVMKVEFVFIGGCDGCAGVVPDRWKRRSPLPAACFLPQSASTRVASRLSTIDSSSTDSTFCSVMNSASVTNGTVLSPSMLIMNCTSIVACIGCPVAWTREATPRLEESVATEL